MDETLSPIVYSRQDWMSSAYRATPLHQQVDQEGRSLTAVARQISLPSAEASEDRTVPDSGSVDRSGEELREQIKAAIRRVEPEAEIILYGSRARGDARPDSDWDLLVLVDGTTDQDRKDAICHELYEVEWSQDEVLCPMVRSREEWDSPLFKAMPFHRNVERDGVFL